MYKLTTFAFYNEMFLQFSLFGLCYVQKDEDDSEKDDRIFFKRGGVLVQTSRRFLKTRWCFECTSNSLSK